MGARPFLELGLRQGIMVPCWDQKLMWRHRTKQAAHSRIIEADRTWQLAEVVQEKQKGVREGSGERK
jgi:hypothetical protein